MRRIATILGVLGLLFGLGCTGCGPDSPGSEALSVVMDSQEFKDACSKLPTCAEPRFQSVGDSETVWRILVLRDEGGEIRFGEIDSVEVTAGSGVPLGPVTGDFALIGLDGNDEPVDGRMVQFPAVARFEFEDQGTPPVVVETSQGRASTVSYLRALPGIKTIALRDSEGKTVASVPAPQAQAYLLKGLSLVAPAMAQAPTSTSSCSHVRVLGQGSEGAMTGSPGGWDITLVNPQPTQLANITAALGRMTPLLCQSVSRIAWATFDDPEVTLLGQVYQVIWGDMMVVNAAAYPEAVLTAGDSLATFKSLDLQHTILHEAGHSAEALLNAEGESFRGMGYGGDWVDSSRALAKQTIDRVRLARGFAEEWRRVHNSYKSLGWARDYTFIVDALQSLADWAEVDASSWLDGEGSPSTWPEIDVAHGGFISPYAATNLADDVADSVAWTYMGHEYAGAGVGDRRRDYACTQMQMHGDKSLPANLSAIYTKLYFLKDLGLVTADDVKSCTGVQIGPEITREGFESWRGSTFSRRYDSGVSAIIGTNAFGAAVFKMEAGGRAKVGSTEYPAKMSLTLKLKALAGAPEGRSTSPIGSMDMVSWPRGAYELDSSFNSNMMALRVDGAANGNLDSEVGYAVVVEASNDRIVGSMFLTRGLRPNTPSPLPVYENFDPPMIIRFLMEK